MPFGRHRGVPLSELDGGYLAWLGGKLDEWREPFRSELAAELARRRGPTLPGTEPARRQTSAQRSASASASSAVRDSIVCDVCGLGPTVQKPLVHAICITDEVPF